MKISEAPSADKKQLIETFLAHGTVMIFIDTRIANVRVPTEYQGHAQLPINLDYTFNIPDLTIHSDRIEATLQFFHSMSFFCVFPFKSIYGMRSEINNHMIIFPEDVPKDLAFQAIETNQKLSLVEKATQAPQQQKPKLMAIKNQEQPNLLKEKPQKKLNQKKINHLRVVK